jgi:hypothetical protein
MAVSFLERDICPCRRSRKKRLLISDKAMVLNWFRKALEMKTGSGRLLVF